MFDKTKKLFQKNSFAKKEKTFSFNPDRDWKFLFLVFIFVNLAIFSYLAIFYFGLNKKNNLEIPLANVETKFVDEKLLEEVLEIYVQKGERLNNLMESAPTTSDPSI